MNYTEKVKSYIEQAKDCEYVSEILFFKIIDTNEIFRNGKGTCLIIDDRNIDDVLELLSKNDKITHLYINTNKIDRDKKSKKKAIKKIVKSMPHNIEYLNIENIMYDLTDEDYEYECCIIKEIIKNL